MTLWAFLLLVVAAISPVLATTCSTTDGVVRSPPVIDLSLPHEQQLAEQLLQASKDWGFFQIINHNLSHNDLVPHRLEREMLRFFSRPLEEKLLVRRNATNARGFAHDEFTKQLKDYKEVFDYGFGFGSADGVNLWPDFATSDSSSSSFHDTLKEYFDKSTVLAQHLMDLLAKALDIDPQYFRRAFAQHSSFARLNYYPPYTPPATTTATSSPPPPPMGISRHTDAGALTLLWQDSPGLQVYSGTKQDNGDGQWTNLRVVPGAIIVNIGDMLQVWTGGVCRAAEHRVVIHAGKRTHRLSVPFFYNPQYSEVMRPIVSESKRLKSYRAFTWERFRAARFAGDYADVGKESQIEDYEE